MVRGFNLTSDLFACKVFEDTEACRELCRILLQDKTIMLKSVRTQYVIRNLETHSMELDILAEQDNGDIVGVEIQMYEEDAPLKRTRYYLSGIDMSILEKGKDYAGLPEVAMIYLTKKDFIGGGRGYYTVERRADDGKGTADALLTYFKNSDPYYRTETFPRIVERVRHFKIRKEGVDIMCEIADRIREEGREEGKCVGRLESRVEDILELLGELGKVPQRIAELIRTEDNLSVLSRWLKSAARAASIEEFEANM